MTDAPNLNNTTRRTPRAAPDSGVHPAQVPNTSGNVERYVKRGPEPMIQMGIKMKPYTRSIIDDIKTRTGLSIVEIVDEEIIEYWGSK